jgi:uncharacterized protein
VRCLVVSDTHLDARRAHLVVDRLGSLLDDVDVILHAGDVTEHAVLHALAAHAPVHAVLGNNDHGTHLPERLIVRLAGCEIAMVHDSGPATGRSQRLRRWFPTADIVVFGHSHIPWHVVDVHAGHEQHQLNPGSAIQRRSQPRCTVARLDLVDGRVESVEHLAVD